MQLVPSGKKTKWLVLLLILGAISILLFSYLGDGGENTSLSSTKPAIGPASPGSRSSNDTSTSHPIAPSVTAPTAAPAPVAGAVASAPNSPAPPSFVSQTASSAAPADSNSGASPLPLSPSSPPTENQTPPNPEVAAQPESTLYLYLRVDRIVVKIQVFDAEFKTQTSRNPFTFCIESEVNSLDGCTFRILDSEMNMLLKSASQTGDNPQPEGFFLIDEKDSEYRLTRQPSNAKKKGQVVEVQFVDHSPSGLRSQASSPTPMHEGPHRIKVKLYTTVRLTKGSP